MSLAGQQLPMNDAQWYDDWQHAQHAISFDRRSGLSARNLARNYEGFNDVRLLRERLDSSRAIRLLEVGCATGEFSRYLRIRYPQVRYLGIDISQAAIARAKAKYPSQQFFAVHPAGPLQESLRTVGIEAPVEFVYAKDVIHHQTQPLSLLEQLMACATDAVIIRTRTRDVGSTEWDPERSCQYHYEGWMPYLVLNLQELIDHIMRLLPASELVIYRHHMLLGGQYNRFLSKAMYLKETGTAETAVGIFKQTTHPGLVTLTDRPDETPRYTWDYTLKHAARQAWDVVRLRAGA